MGPPDWSRWRRWCFWGAGGTPKKGYGLSKEGGAHGGAGYPPEPTGNRGATSLLQPSPQRSITTANDATIHEAARGRAY